jgi:hypothetical protein
MNCTKRETPKYHGVFETGDEWKMTMLIYHQSVRRARRRGERVPHEAALQFNSDAAGAR